MHGGKWFLIPKCGLPTFIEAEEAKETGLFYKDTLKHFSQDGTNSRKSTYEKIRKGVKENNSAPMLYTQEDTRLVTEIKMSNSIY